MNQDSSRRDLRWGERGESKLFGDTERKHAYLKKNKKKQKTPNWITDRTGEYRHIAVSVLSKRETSWLYHNFKS